MDPYAFFQGTNRERPSANGYPHRIPQRTTTSRVVLITRKLRPGFFKAVSFRSGSRQVHFFGFTENVRPVVFPTLTPSNTILYCSGLGQEHSLVRSFLAAPVGDD